MNIKSRIDSFTNTNSLDASITGISTFELSSLNLNPNLELPIPTNLRLGHLAEEVVAELIKASKNYYIHYKNIQIIDDKTTLGEIDFIIENTITHQLIHLELAYKFYLFDPSISQEPINNWIAPNRNDSLKDKLQKLKEKQFPLLHHENTKSSLKSIDTNKVTQSLCLLASLYVPYDYKESFNDSYQKEIKGYYLNLATFTQLDDSDKTYYLPPKREWGMDPSKNEVWSNLNTIEADLKKINTEQRSSLCWQKHNDTYLEFFIVWW